MSTMNLMDSIENLNFTTFSHAYKPIHGWLATGICLFGIPSNLINIIVLTRPAMIKSPTNLILTGLAISDLLTMLSYLPYLIYFYIIYEKLPIDERDTLFWTYYALINIMLSVTAHSISIWLTVYLACFRFIFIASSSFIGHGNKKADKKAQKLNNKSKKLPFTNNAQEQQSQTQTTVLNMNESGNVKTLRIAETNSQAEEAARIENKKLLKNRSNSRYFVKNFFVQLRTLKFTLIAMLLILLFCVIFCVPAYIYPTVRKREANETDSSNQMTIEAVTRAAAPVSGVYSKEKLNSKQTSASQEKISTYLIAMVAQANSTATAKKPNQYYLDESDFNRNNNNIVFKLTFYMQAILGKFIPCILLVTFSSLLIYSLIVINRNNKKLNKSSNLKNKYNRALANNFKRTAVAVAAPAVAKSVGDSNRAATNQTASVLWPLSLTSRLATFFPLRHFVRSQKPAATTIKIKIDNAYVANKQDEYGLDENFYEDDLTKNKHKKKPFGLVKEKSEQLNYLNTASLANFRKSNSSPLFETPSLINALMQDARQNQHQQQQQYDENEKLISSESDDKKQKSNRLPHRANSLSKRVDQNKQSRQFQYPISTNFSSLNIMNNNENNIENENDDLNDYDDMGEFDEFSQIDIQNNNNDNNNNNNNCGKFGKLKKNSLGILKKKEVKEVNKLKKIKSSRKKEHLRTTSMLVVVCILFLISELPQSILMLFSLIFHEGKFYHNVYLALGDLMDLLALVNNSINFLLYCTMSRAFRNTFYTLIANFWCCTLIRKRILKDNTVTRTTRKTNVNSNNFSLFTRDTAYPILNQISKENSNLNNIINTSNNKNRNHNYIDLREMQQS
jgi:hypothetical protein